MCTITKQRPVLEIAKEDITVYKICENVSKYIAFSLWGKYVYNLNVICKTKLDPFTFTIDDYRSNQGFYSYKNCNSNCNCKFIIPKEAQYYLCLDKVTGEFIYHSDQIKFIGLL